MQVVARIDDTDVIVRHKKNLNETISSIYATEGFRDQPQQNQILESRNEKMKAEWKNGGIGCL